MIPTKLKTWAITIGAALLSVGVAILYGIRKGKAWQKGTDDARGAQANIQAVQQVQQTQESRYETDAEVSTLPDKGPQQVATADSNTAAGKLRDDGWVRQESSSKN